MSARIAMPLRLRTAAIAIGMFAGCVLVAAGSPPPPVPSPGSGIAAEKIDDRPPIPPENLKAAADAEKLKIDKEKAIFTGLRDSKTNVVKGGIEDDRPLASEKQNADEYQAITEVMLHATQFSATELAQHGRRDLTPDDLTYNARFQYRLELVRFEGKLTKARRLKPTKSLEDTGFKEFFEASLVPDDESPGYPVKLLLSSWPAEFANLPAIADGQQAGESVTIDRWVAFGGYFFKLMTYPGPGADPKTPTGAGWLKAPLLMGKTVVPLPDPAEKIELDKNLRVFKGIRDNTEIPSENSEFWEERSAWNRIVLHARRFSTTQLDADANKKVTFENLFHESQDHRLELVSIQGRMIRLVQMKSPERIAKANLDKLYVAWIVPNDQAQGHPVSLVISDLPAGIEPQKTMDVPVTATGYSFKVLRYESGEVDKGDPTKFVKKLTPMLIGRSVSVRQENEDSTTTWWTQGFVPAVVGSVIVLGGAALLMSWFFRRGDKLAQAEIDASRRKNPFDE